MRSGWTYGLVFTAALVAGVPGFLFAQQPDLDPRIEKLVAAVSEERLTSIPGQPPDLNDLPSGCPFAPRCDHRRSACAEVSMQLVVVDGQGHQSACPFFETTGL